MSLCWVSQGIIKWLTLHSVVPLNVIMPSAVAPEKERQKQNHFFFSENYSKTKVIETKWRLAGKGERETETDRQTFKEGETEKEMDGYRQAVANWDRERNREWGKVRERWRETERDLERQWYKGKHNQRRRERNTNTQTGRLTDRQWVLIRLLSNKCAININKEREEWERDTEDRDRER
jgi:hypothetical protein